MKEQVKGLRVKIDGLYQLTKELKPVEKGFQILNEKGEKEFKHLFSASQEIKNAAHSLIYAKAWLGKVLGELGAENPYKSGYKTVADIEPTADSLKFPPHEDFLYGKWGKMNHIEKVDWLRTEIENCIKFTKTIGQISTNSFTKEFNIARTNAYNYLCEARFALGFELERIKLENKQKIKWKQTELKRN